MQMQHGRSDRHHHQYVESLCLSLTLKSQTLVRYLINMQRLKALSYDVVWFDTFFSDRNLRFAY